MRIAAHLALISALFLCDWAPLAAQETRGAIFGRVTDSTSATVAGATVTVKSTDTNISVRAVANDTGYYEANLLQPGNYQVTAEHPGFKTTLRSGIVLLTSSRVQVDVRLEVGNLAESITVTEEAPLLDTQSGSSGRILDNKTQAGLPQTLGQIIPAVRYSAGVQFTGTFAAYAPNSQGGTTGYNNGVQVGGNQFALDGGLTMAQNRFGGLLPHSDTIAEMKMEVAGFDATIGQTTGIVVSLVSKAGTNQLHGSATEGHMQVRWNGTPFFTRQFYYRNIADALARGDQARADWLAQQPKQSSGHRNTFAGTIGGPVYIPKIIDGRNKLFFFLSYAGDRWRTTMPSSELNHTFPTMPQREGDFSDLLKTANAARYQLYDPFSVRPDPARAGHYIRTPIPGNIVPTSRITNPMYKHYVRLLPQPNNNPTNPALDPVNNFLAVQVPNSSYWNSLNNRYDWQPSEQHRIFSRITWDDYYLEMRDWAYQTQPGLMSTGGVRRNLGGVADWVYTPTPTTVIDYAVSFHRYSTVTNGAPGAKKFKPSDVDLPKYMDDFSAHNHMLPVVSAADYNVIGLPYEAMIHAQTAMTKLDVTHVRGKHSLRAGADVRIQQRAGGAGGYPSGNFTFNNTYTRRNDDTLTPAANLGHSWAAFMMGVGSWQTGRLDSSVLRTNYHGFYLQDSWRPGRKLTINLGLRAEYELGPVERYDRMVTYFDPAVQLPITAGAQAGYAAKPVPELQASQFRVLGGSIFAGAGSNGRRMFNNALMWLPRASAAYAIDSKTVVRGGYGVFYDGAVALNYGVAQPNYARTTTPILTNDFGSNWLIGNPANGVSPMLDPFPVRSDGTRFDEPLGNRLGAMTQAAGSWSGVYYDTPRARQQRWRASVQRQFGRSTVLEVAYAGSYSNDIGVARNENYLPQQYWATGMVRNDALASNMNATVPNPFLLSNFASLAQSDPVLYRDLSNKAFYTAATQRKQQLLRPFPHMSGVTATVPLGAARMHDLEVSLERRFANGFNFYAAYTRLMTEEKVTFFDEWDREPIWLPSDSGRPHRFVATSIWELPFGKGRRYELRQPALDWIAGGWQLSLIYEYQPGPLIAMGNMFYNGDLSNITSVEPTFGQWFNTDGFERNAAKGPAAYHARVFPTQIDGLRADGHNLWSGNVSKQFRIKERAALTLRWDVLNIFNRTIMNAPVVNPYTTDFGRVTASTQAKRWMQIQAKLTF